MRLASCYTAAFTAVLLWLSTGLTGVMAQQNATITGFITDAESEEPLVGATVILSQIGQAGISGGDAASADGSYQIVGLTPGTYTLTVRYVGYNESQSPVTLQAGQTATVNVALTQGGLDLNTIVISASRQAEKVLDAPASISVLDAQEIEQDVVQSAVSILRNTTGVDVAQTGVDRNEVVLRGFNNAFSSSAYILTDYRQAAVPALNVNLHSIMPTLPIDIERIEVVRGPGSALYGPGVDEGVIHYISKDPFSYPGTTVSITGGERSLFGGQLRHAGVINDRVGYKVTGFYSQADDWELDPGNPEDLEQLNMDNPSFGRQRDYDFNKFNLNGLLQFRLGDGVSLTGTGGYSQLNAVVLSGIGALQADEFSNSYGQLRLQANRFFAQAYFSKNDAGNSLVYGSAQTVVDKGFEYNAQAQYDFDLAEERVRIIVGGDAQFTRPDTEGTILGRNEDDDDVSEIGGYAQSTIALSPQLDLTLATRGDWSNIFDFQISPRAALVFKVDPRNTLRATYNRSFASPGTNSLFLDILSQQTPVSADRNLLIYGRGAADGFTFDVFRDTGLAQSLLPISPPLLGEQIDVNRFPIFPFYGAVAAGGGVDLLANVEAPLPAPLPDLTDQQRGLLAQLFGYTAQNALLANPTVDAYQSSSTEFGFPVDRAVDPRGFTSVDAPIDVPPLEQTTTQTIEVGYKGLINNNILFAIDGYWTNKKDFIGPVLLESPFVYINPGEFGTDVAMGLGQLFVTTDDPQVQGLLQNLGLSGLTPTDVATILGTVVAGGTITEGGWTRFAVVAPDQELRTEDRQTTANIPALASYRNFGNIDYWGIDASLQVLATDEITLFANVSFIDSNDFFEKEDLESNEVVLKPALNAPKFKAKLGGSYRLRGGLSVSASARYVDEFPVNSGPFRGLVDSYFLVDLGAGYDFQQSVPGLRLDFSIQNVADNEHYEFVGAPQIGRMGLLRLTYTIE